ncbi:MAG TPA: right-handed parallel beta-helix repeat-containing protein [Thermoanaerobaculia bacterium]
MRAALTCLIAVLLTAPLLAQPTITVDLQLSDGHAVNPARLRIGTRVVYSVFVSSEMPLTAEIPLELDIPGFVYEVGSRSTPCTGTHPIACTLGPAGSYVSELIVVHTILDRGGPQTAKVRVQGRETTITVEVADVPTLSIGAATINIAGRRVDPGGLLQYSSFFAKEGVQENVRIRYTLPNGGTFIAVRSGVVPCELTPGEIVCTVARDFQPTIEIDARAPAHLTGGTAVLRAEILYDGPDFDPSDNTAEVVTRLVRHLIVTNTNDEGSGSLRQALLDAQTLCADTPCTIAFNIAEAAPNGIFVIRPRSALPELRGWLKIDGGSRISILGNDAGLAHGLLLGRGCELQVLNLFISGFAWPGIEAQRTSGPTCNSLDRAIATPLLIAGNEIRGNYRGVVLAGSADATIRDNLIEGNVRAGIFVDRTFSVFVTNNRVVGNGASGMFFNLFPRDTASSAHVTHNLIAGNGEWGITRTDNGNIAIQRNSIYGNAHPAIDLNLDFDTPNRPADDFSSIPNKPVLFSAHYDPARQMTYVTGRLETAANGSSIEIDFYVDEHPTRRHLGAWVASFLVGGTAVEREFTFAIPRNLLGKYLVATNTRQRHGSGLLLMDTSEVSNAVPVQ